MLLDRIVSSYDHHSYFLVCCLSLEFCAPESAVGVLSPSVTEFSRNAGCGQITGEDVHAEKMHPSHHRNTFLLHITGDIVVEASGAAEDAHVARKVDRIGGRHPSLYSD